MKKIICYFDEPTGSIYQDEQCSWFLGSVNPSIATVEYAENNQGDTVPELTKAGVSIEDILKLKHAGVI